MKDLIKKKTQSTGGWKDDVIYCYPANNNIEYNLITAPKSIKLSEIVSRLNDCKIERANCCQPAKRCKQRCFCLSNKN